MPASVWDREVQAAIDRARARASTVVTVDGRRVQVPRPFPSPADWRDRPIYFLMVDRFDNPAAPPRHLPYDAPVGAFQGGTLDGVRRRLDYLCDLGVGAIWLTPVLRNVASRDSFHGYGIQDFLRVDPRLAADPANAEGELRALVDEAHARDLLVVFDVVLNHAGDVFAYVQGDARLDAADFREEPYPIEWRDETGRPRAEWREAPDGAAGALHPDAAVAPAELRANRCFRRQGKGGEAGGDFESLKELVTADPEVRTALIRIHEYLIAEYDVDGFRIDTLKYVEEDFARTFGNAMREFAQSIGKRRFFTFGEVYDDEEKIARFVGRNAALPGDLTGVDAALDFPLFYKLPGMAKGQVAPAEVAHVFEHRKAVQRGIVSSHGEASRYFVTFLDNHDQHHRFHHRDPADPARWDAQATLGFTCLYTLQGIPCLYYGTEQGLHGAGDSDRDVREALWGKPDAFDRAHPFFRALQALAALRRERPALRYGRQYVRPLSGDGRSFGVSPFRPGVLAFSRVLSDEEVVVVANAHPESAASVEVVVDHALHAGASFRVAFANLPDPAAPGVVVERAADVTVHEVDGRVTHGPVRALPVTLRPMEAQVLVRA